MIIFLIVRPKGRLEICPRCKKKKLMILYICPHCKVPERLIMADRRMMIDMEN
jgi:Zn finger protein HypA/HybF involved in hydrogenase expression